MVFRELVPLNLATKDNFVMICFFIKINLQLGDKPVYCRTGWVRLGNWQLIGPIAELVTLLTSKMDVPLM